MTILDKAFISDFTSTFIFTDISVVVSVSTGRTEENVVSMYTVTLLLLKLIPLTEHNDIFNIPWLFASIQIASSIIFIRVSTLRSSFAFWTSNLSYYETWLIWIQKEGPCLVLHKCRIPEVVKPLLKYPDEYWFLPGSIWKGKWSKYLHVENKTRCSSISTQFQIYCFCRLCTW